MAGAGPNPRRLCRSGPSAAFAGQKDRPGWAGRIFRLSTGLYLVKGEQYEEKGHIYTPEAIAVSLPALSEDGGWSYHQKVSCKFDSTETSSEFVQRKVCKVWEDNGNQESRPKEILVQLLENSRVSGHRSPKRGEPLAVYMGEFKGQFQMAVAEAKTPEGYTVSVAQEGSTFIMTNTCPSDTPSRLPQTGMLWWPVPLLACAACYLWSWDIF